MTATPATSRVRMGDVITPRNDIIHPRDNPTGPDVFVGLEHVESGTGRRLGSEDIDKATMTGRKATFRAGDIVYGYLRPYLNKVWLADFDGLCSVDQYVYVVDQRKADAEYIAWFMRSPLFLSRAPVDSGPGQLPRIRLNEIARVELDLPPLPEQKRVAEALRAEMDAAARLRAAADAEAKSADHLFARRLALVFDSRGARGWPVEPLGDAGEIVSGVTLGRKLNGRATRPVAYLRVANVKDGRLDLADVYAVEATEAEIAKLELLRGDVLLTEGGDPDKLGRGTVWAGQVKECIHQNHIFRLRLDRERFVPEFVSFQLGSRYGKAYFARHAKQTTGIATINQRVLRGFPLMAPSDRSAAPRSRGPVPSADSRGVAEGPGRSASGGDWPPTGGTSPPSLLGRLMTWSLNLCARRSKAVCCVFAACLARPDTSDCERRRMLSARSRRMEGLA